MRRAHPTMRCRRRWCGSSAQSFGYTIAYTWSKTLDEGGDGYFGVEGGVPEDPYNPKGSRGPASFDILHILTANAIYQLPFGTGKRFATGNRFADYVIGNSSGERDLFRTFRATSEYHSSRRYCQHRERGYV